jgi:hypothetical protein
MNRMANRPKGFLILTFLLILFALGMVIFWIMFFQTEMFTLSESDVYDAHERSFPLADGYLALCAIICVVGLIRMRNWALLFGLLTGSGLIFLGLMDLLWSYNQGFLNSMDQAAIQSSFITVICLVLGAVTIIYLWRNREYLS